MKRIIALFVAMSLAAGVFAQTQMVRMTRDNGKDITSLNVSSGFDVEIIHATDKCRAEIEIPAKVKENVVFSLSDDGVLTIGFNRSVRLNVNGKKPLRAKVYMKEIKSLKFSGGVDAHCNGTFAGESVTIETSGGVDFEGLDISVKDRATVTCSGGSKLEAKINARYFICNVSGGAGADIVSNGENANVILSGAGKLDISGSAKVAGIDASSASSFDGEEYNVGSLNVTTSSAANVKVGVVTELTAKSSSASTIRYKGNPKIISLNSSSASTIRKED